MGSAPFSIFVVEDDEWFNKLLMHTASLNPDFEVKSFSSARDFLSQLSIRQPDAVTLDYRLPDATGGEVLQKIKELSPNTEVVIISEQENIETAVELLKLGAYDYIVKGKDIRDRLLNTINNIRKNAQLKTRIEVLEKEVQKKYDFQNTIIGESPAIKKIFDLIEKAITTDITVTVTGETGTGKELVAKAIHYNSKRRNGPFVAVNTAAIPSELIESELFGHEKGSFTGAIARRVGKFEEANGGTLFLDEIGEMDFSFQAKLLRTLQEREFTRIGSNTPVKTDCRIIVATNRNLKEEVKNGKFREDLYYRVFGLPIELPPLRERDKDILILSKFFVGAFCKENKLNNKKITEDAQKKLLSYNFPGNIRELKAIVELATVMSNGSDISASDVSLSSSDALPEVMSDELSLREYELRIVKMYLKKYDDNIKLVAEKLAIGQSTIYRMLKEDMQPKGDLAISSS
jgi:DNA-binding NtrC family response regulator